MSRNDDGLPMLPPWLSESEVTQVGYEAPVQNLPPDDDPAPRRGRFRNRSPESDRPDSGRREKKRRGWRRDSGSADREDSAAGGAWGRPGDAGTEQISHGGGEGGPHSDAPGDRHRSRGGGHGGFSPSLGGQEEAGFARGPREQGDTGLSGAAAQGNPGSPQSEVAQGDPAFRQDAGAHGDPAFPRGAGAQNDPAFQHVADGHGGAGFPHAAAQGNSGFPHSGSGYEDPALARGGAAAPAVPHDGRQADSASPRGMSDFGTAAPEHAADVPGSRAVGGGEEVALSRPSLPTRNPSQPSAAFQPLGTPATGEGGLRETSATAERRRGRPDLPPPPPDPPTPEEATPPERLSAPSPAPADEPEDAPHRDLLSFREGLSALRREPELDLSPSDGALGEPERGVAAPTADSRQRVPEEPLERGQIGTPDALPPRAPVTPAAGGSIPPPWQGPTGGQTPYGPSAATGSGGPPPEPPAIPQHSAEPPFSGYASAPSTPVVPSNFGVPTADPLYPPAPQHAAPTSYPTPPASPYGPGPTPSQDGGTAGGQGPNPYAENAPAAVGPQGNRGVAPADNPQLTGAPHGGPSPYGNGTAPHPGDDGLRPQGTGAGQAPGPNPLVQGGNPAPGGGGPSTRQPDGRTANGVPPQGPPMQYGQNPPLYNATPPNTYNSTPGGPAPSLDNVPMRRAKRSPGSGWRKAVHHVSGGAINPGMSAEERRLQELVARIRQPVRGDYRIAVLSLKGGVGKTTTTMGLGSIFASIRGDRVIAVDANPDFGTLSQRVPLQTRSTVRDLLLDPAIQRYSDVRRHTSQGTSRLEVLASERDPAASEAFSDEEYRAVARILQRFYNIILTDCGTGLMHSAMTGVLDMAHSLVLISSVAIDGARSAAATLDWLSLHGHDHLVRNAVVVINLPREGSPSDSVQHLRKYFLSRCRAVHIIPYDAHLSEGAEIDLHRLHKNTKRAYVELAATVADEFAADYRPYRS